MKTPWEEIYTTKVFEETSWYQSRPENSLTIIESLGLSRNATIIDVGGGNSYLVDHLLDIGYKNLSVLDISATALQDAKNRIGENSGKVEWIESDITKFSSEDSFQVWHDRAAFHFLTSDKQVDDYKSNLKTSLKSGGYFILATFSENGPDKCSGINVRRYSTEAMERLFETDFDVVRVESIDHTTPTNQTQNFTLGLFRKK